MRYFVTFLLMVLLATAAFAGATDSVEGPTTCSRCGMNRTTFAQSRMLVVYTDGTSIGVCSLHCAAAELHQNRDKLADSLMVADYSTKKLLDAGTATWVVGGTKTGVMTAQAKWAFASAGDAARFVRVYGGVVSSFDQAMKSATREVMDQADEEKAVESEFLRELL